MADPFPPPNLAPSTNEKLSLLETRISALEAELAAIRTDPIHESWESKSREELLDAFRWQGQMTAAQADMVAKYRKATMLVAANLQALAAESKARRREPRAYDESKQDYAESKQDFQDRVMCQATQEACWTHAGEILEKSVNLCIAEE